MRCETSVGVRLGPSASWPCEEDLQVFIHVSGQFEELHFVCTFLNFHLISL